MNKKSKKGTSLIVVFIICTVIGILLSTTFLVVSNYGVTIFQRKRQLRKIVNPSYVDIDEITTNTETTGDTQTEGEETSGEETSGETTNPEETQTGEATPETPEEGSVE